MCCLNVLGFPRWCSFRSCPALYSVHFGRPVRRILNQKIGTSTLRESIKTLRSNTCYVSSIYPNEMRSSSVLFTLLLSHIALAQKVVLTNDDGWAVAQIRAQFDALNAAGFNVCLYPLHHLRSSNPFVSRPFYRHPLCNSQERGR